MFHKLTMPKHGPVIRQNTLAKDPKRERLSDVIGRAYQIYTRRRRLFQKTMLQVILVSLPNLSQKPKVKFAKLLGKAPKSVARQIKDVMF